MSAEIIHLFGDKTLQHSTSDATLRGAEFVARIPPGTSPDDQEACVKALKGLDHDGVEEDIRKVTADLKEMVEQEKEVRPVRNLTVFSLAAFVFGGWLVAPILFPILFVAVVVVGIRRFVRIVKRSAHEV